jgi:hypothetical protein
LFPHSGTFEDCTTADRLYDSRHEWFQHELEAHRTSWQCIEGCEKGFKAQSEFESHLQKDHAELATILPAIKRTSMRRANLIEQVACVLCQKKTSLRGLQKHLASHQQQLALFALPPNLDETEEDKDDEDNLLGVKDSDDEDLSDISDSQLPIEELPIDDVPHLNFTDAVGRKYDLLWHNCKKWKVCTRQVQALCFRLPSLQTLNVSFTNLIRRYYRPTAAVAMNRTCVTMGVFF